jgi:glutamate-1-semialdehyde 2,1-aminomutase
MTYSQSLFQRAQKLIPGGVNSPVRAFGGVGGTPIFFSRGEGPYLFAVDGNRYIDYVGSFGPLILGHAHPAVIEAVQKAVSCGLSFGAPTEAEIRLAEKISELMPNIEMVRLVNSGTEATLTAIRLARGYTQRDKIIKFNGCYHGHSDSLLVKAGSGALTFGIPDSAGVPPDVVRHTLTAEYNNLEQVTALFAKEGETIAGVIVEPIAGNMNCVLPQPGFLAGLRTLCDQYNSLLIFDEVMTGFRVGPGGAQTLFKIKPDLTTLGKVIGGGLPVGAVGGRKAIMEHLAPLGPVYQAGTLSGNPVTAAAGLATLIEISKPNFYRDLSKKTSQLIDGLNNSAQQHNIPFLAQSIGSMFGIFFTDEPSILSYEQVKKTHIERFKKCFHMLLAEGIYLAPSAYEAGFVSAAHSEADIIETITKFDRTLEKL